MPNVPKSRKNSSVVVKLNSKLLLFQLKPTQLQIQCLSIHVQRHFTCHLCNAWLYNVMFIHLHNTPYGDRAAREVDKPEIRTQPTAIIWGGAAVRILRYPESILYRAQR